MRLTNTTKTNTRRQDGLVSSPTRADRSSGIGIARNGLTFAPPVFPRGTSPKTVIVAAPRIRKTCRAISRTSCRRTPQRSMRQCARTCWRVDFWPRTCARSRRRKPARSSPRLTSASAASNSICRYGSIRLRAVLITFLQRFGARSSRALSGCNDRYLTRRRRRHLNEGANQAGNRVRWGIVPASIGSSRQFGYHRARARESDSHAEFRIVAEGFHQNDGRCRRRRELWPRCGRPRVQASGTEETDANRRPVSGQPEGQRKLRRLSVFRVSEELRRGRGRDQRERLVPHLYAVPTPAIAARISKERRDLRLDAPCPYAMT